MSHPKTGLENPFNPTDEPPTHDGTGSLGVGTHQHDGSSYSPGPWASAQCATAGWGWPSDSRRTSETSFPLDASAVATLQHDFSSVMPNYLSAMESLPGTQQVTYAPPMTSLSTGQQTLPSDGGYWWVAPEPSSADHSIAPGQYDQTTDCQRSQDNAAPPEELPKKKRGRPRLYLDSGRRIPRAAETRMSTLGTASARLDGNATPALASGKARLSAPTTPTKSDAEREQVRSRNRAAATRYRNKMSAVAEALEAQMEELSGRRVSLSASAGQLRNEIYELKSQVFVHSNCNDPLINGYLAQAAQQVHTSLPSTGRAA